MTPLAGPLLAAASSPREIQAACGTDPHFWCRQTLDWTHDRALAQLADTIIGLPLRIAAIVIVAAILNRLARRAVRGTLTRLHVGAVRERVGALRGNGGGNGEASLRAEQRIDALSGVLRSVVSVVIFTITSFMVLGEVGLNLAPLLTGAGIVGVALGFGAQSLVKDFLSGIFILVEDQFGVGDVVWIDADTNGTVELVSLRTTRLRGGDGTVWHVPNGEIRKVGNKSQHWSRTVLELVVAPTADLGRAKDVIKREADAVWHEDDAVLEEPELWGVDEVSSTGVKIGLGVKTTPSEQWRVGRVLRERIKLAFDREGIPLPAPPVAAPGPPAAP